MTFTYNRQYYLETVHLTQIKILQSMQNSVFYYNKNVMAKIPNERIIQTYSHVTFEDKQIKVVQLTFQVTTHRLIFTSNSDHAFVINGDRIQNVQLGQQGFWNKQYYLKIKTKYNEKVRIFLDNYKDAQVMIDSMIKKQQWTKIPTIQEKKESGMYSGMAVKIQKDRQNIMKNESKVQQSFSSFDNLLGNLRDLKQIMSQIRTTANKSDGDNPQIHNILKDIGFVSVISRQQSGRDYVKLLAKDLYNICETTLFQKYGGMVSLLDLFYFYNRKRQMQLVSPGQIRQACEQFQKFGFNAKLVVYPNNIKMIQSTSFNSDKDFQEQFKTYFKDYSSGYTAEEISKKKGLPLTVIQIKLKKAVKKGKLAVADRIQGVKYYRNLIVNM